ncbi:MAG: hypothetical protein HYZ29_18225 [Myxococcales bacterium]|nr:hypothetical protein [Myxococcales bacterium]
MIVAPEPDAAAEPVEGREAAAAPAAVLPFAFTSLGGPCPKPAKSSRTVLCNASGRVTGIWAPVDTVDGTPPAGAQVIRDEPRRDFAPGRSLTVALEGERIWVRLVSCGACRRVMGWAFVGDLSLLSDEQLDSLQERVGLPASPRLGTAAAWRAAYRNRPLSALPDGIDSPHAPQVPSAGARRRDDAPNRRVPARPQG